MNRMQSGRIVFVDDLLREEFVPARKLFYNLVAPCLGALGYTTPDLRKFPQSRGLRHDFNPETLRSLCGEKDWKECYRALPSAASAYLREMLPEDCLAIGYEMPPWLVDLLSKEKIPYVDIRISPIRFARDLILALDSNLPGLIRATDELAVGRHELAVEAGLLKASVQYREERRVPTSDAVVFIGQTQSDASLLDEQGRVLSVGDFGSEIRSIVGKRVLLYKKHPYAGTFAKLEQSQLSRIVGRDVKATNANIYSLLAGSSKITLLTISSGAAQEAPFFEQEGRFLHKPLCGIRCRGEPDPGHALFHFTSFASPLLWAKITGVSASDADLQLQQPMGENKLRRIHDIWWGYSDFVLDSEKIWQRVVTRGLRNIIFRYMNRRN